jgi:hypothetical protein
LTIRCGAASAGDANIASAASSQSRTIKTSSARR